MSVWEATTYKLDIAKLIYRYIPSKIDRILGPKVSPYLAPKGRLSPIDTDWTWDDVASLLKWESEVLAEIDEEEIEALMKGVGRWLVGIQGVYTLIHALYIRKFDVVDQYNYTAIEHKMQALQSVVVTSTLITPPVFANTWNLANRDLIDMSRRFENFAEAWKYFARFMKLKKNIYTEIDQDKIFGRGDRIYYGGSIGPLIILRGSSTYTERGIILTRKHLDMLIGASLRISCLLDYAAREYATDRVMTQRIVKMLELTIKTSFACSRVNVDKVVQAFHKARSYMQMRMFENQMNDALLEACIEYGKKNLQTVLDLVQYVQLFDNVPKGRWLDILHVYKWMPPPDFDSTYAFEELRVYHMSTRASALDYTATQEMRDLWEIIVRERKLNIATTFSKINNKWPDSLGTTNNFPTEAQLDAWDPVALFPYFTYGQDVTSQIKDKATVLPRLNDEVSSTGKSYDKNFLLWFLAHKDEIDTNKIADQLMSYSLPEDNYVRVAYKGEAHKPGSRLFFMAPPRQRLVLGELEGNISRIACHYPASLQGVDALKKAARLEKLFSLDPTSLYVESGSIYTAYIITFDLSKFSPRFNPAVLQDLHRFWAKVFNYEPILAYGALGSRSTILHTTNRLVMKYENQGADLEGFRGRMMTLFHADLIAAACRVAKERGHILGRAQSAVFIDDGAVKIAAAGQGAIARANALKFLECMQQVYAAAGQENHPNKTIVSAIGGELLAEQFLYGQKLKCAMKAAMRMFPPYESPCATITEEFDALFSTAQGSVKDGCSWIVAYRRLAEGYAKALHRWGRHDFRKLTDVQFAFRMVMPKSIGGFGFPSLQALTSTTAYDLTTEGLGIMSAAAKAYVEYEEVVNKILNRSVVVRTPLQVFRDPGRVRLVGDVLVEGRMSNAIFVKLSDKEGPWTTFVSLAKDKDLVEHATAIAVELLNREAVSLPVLKRAWDCTPLAYM